jgi:hypothetical protein
MALLTPATAPCRRTGECSPGHRPAFLMVLFATAIVWFASVEPQLRAQEFNPREYQVKAVFLFNFVQFVEWPATAFPSADAPIRIGVLGDNPFSGALEAAVQGEKVRNRSIVVEPSSRLESLRDCHVVFVSRSQRAEIGTILAVLGSRPVLTIGEVPDFAGRGGIINFYLEGQKVRFEINRAAAQRSGLKLSSQLLTLARLVGPPVAFGDR